MSGFYKGPIIDKPPITVILRGTIAPKNDCVKGLIIIDIQLTLLYV